MPEFPTVVPMLSYEHVGAAADWLVLAFGLEEVERIAEDGVVGHVPLRLGQPGETSVSQARLRRESDAAARTDGVPWVVDGGRAQVDDVEAALRARPPGGRANPVGARGGPRLTVVPRRGLRGPPLDVRPADVT